MRFSDEFIETMGKKFVALNLYRKNGIRFDTFLIHHKSILSQVNSLPDNSYIFSKGASHAS